MTRCGVTGRKGDAGAPFGYLPSSRAARRPDAAGLVRRQRPNPGHAITTRSDCAVTYPVHPGAPMTQRAVAISRTGSGVTERTRLRVDREPAQAAPQQAATGAESRPQLTGVGLNRGTDHLVTGARIRTPPRGTAAGEPARRLTHHVPVIDGTRANGPLTASMIPRRAALHPTRSGRPSPESGKGCFAYPVDRYCRVTCCRCYVGPRGGTAGTQHARAGSATRPGYRWRRWRGCRSCTLPCRGGRRRVPAQ